MQKVKLYFKALLVILCISGIAGSSAKADNARALKVRSDVKVTGTVKSSDGETLPGVSVALKGTTTGAVTDVNGNFSLTVPDEGGTLVFTYVGFTTQEVAITSSHVVNVVLQTNSRELSQVVVIGYGTVKKSDLTGSVSSVKAEELRATVSTSFDQALQGRAAGVQVTQASGQPGGGASIRIRGTSSILAGNEPLYVVDGMLINSDPADMSGGASLGPPQSPLSSINPNDIESIEVLKDASATAIYGSRGTNGVVLITTRRGKAGSNSVNFDSYYGIQQISHQVKLLNAEQFANFVNEAKLNANQTPIYVNPKNLGEGTNWQDALYRNAPIASYNISFNGGDDKTTYNISGGYFNQDGIIINSNFKRYTFRENLDRQISSKFSVGNSLGYTRTTNVGVLTTSNAGPIVPGVVTDVLSFNPVLPIYNANQPGGYTFENIGNGFTGITLGNPIAEATEYNSYGVTSRVIGNFYAKYKILKDLEFKTTFGIDAFNDKESSFGPNFLKRTQASKGEAAIGTVQGITWLNENTLNYSHEINKNNSFNVLLGYTLQKFQNESVFLYAFGFTDNRTGYHNIQSASSPQAPSNAESQWQMESYLARANYTLFNKYLFTFSGRIDGSSKFAQGSQYGFFPSGAFAWRLSDEDFIKNIKSISNLKFRASYGLIGNQAISPYRSLALIGPYGQGVFNSSNGSEIYNGKEPIQYANKDLKWETTAQFDMGIDLGLFNDRLTLTADYYNKSTRDLLLDTPIPTTTGFSTTTLNVGNIKNQGFEFDLRSVNTTGKLKWNTAVNFSLNRNKVTKLVNGSDILLAGGNILREGQPVGSFYGYEFDGIFQSDAEAANGPALVGQTPRAGDRRYKDIKQDGVINADDRVILGSAQPKFTYGINNSFNFKNFDLSFFFQGSYGNKMANLTSLNLLNFTGQNNVLAEAALNRWTPTNPSNEYPRALAGGNGDAGTFSSAIVEDASYLRLKSLSLAYTFNIQALQKIKVKSIRVFVNGTNLWTITKYRGYDPEANTYGTSTSILGVDNGGYPLAKVYTLGLNVGF